MGFYVVSTRAQASAIFYPGRQLMFEVNHPEHPDWGPFNLTLRTRYLTEGYDAPVPLALWADIRGNAPDLPSAVHAFVNAADEIANIVAFGVNASMGKIEPEVAFDANSERNEHEFVQWFMADWPLVPVPGRPIDAETMTALVARVNEHPEGKRVRRAIAQYTGALRSWVVGNEIPCIAHLYMGVEAISPAVLRDHKKRSGKTKDELETEWGGGRGQQSRWFDNEVRRRLVFHGDTGTFEVAKKVRDQVGHGLRDLGEIHPPARAVIVKTASHLRSTIIGLLGLDADYRSKLPSGDYEVARGPLVVWRRLSGVLVGPEDKLAATGQVYPALTLDQKLKAVAIGDDGRLGAEMADSYVLKVGDGIKLLPEHFEV